MESSQDNMQSTQQAVQAGANVAVGQSSGAAVDGALATAAGGGIGAIVGRVTETGSAKGFVWGAVASAALTTVLAVLPAFSRKRADSRAADSQALIFKELAKNSDSTLMENPYARGGHADALKSSSSAPAIGNQR